MHGPYVGKVHMGACFSLLTHAHTHECMVYGPSTRSMSAFIRDNIARELASIQAVKQLFHMSACVSAGSIEIARPL